MRSFVARFSLLLFVSGAVFSQSPSPNYVQPSAAAPGASTVVTVMGENLGAHARIWLSFPAKVSPGTESTPFGEDKGVFQVTLLPDAPVGIGAFRIAGTNGLSNLRMLAVDELLSVTESSTNKTPQTAQELRFPAAVDGACEELSFDYYRISARQGQAISVEAVAQRLGFELDPVLRLLDAAGRELAYCDDAPGLGSDARVVHRASETGMYLIEVRDVRYRGGSKHRYRLRVGDAELPPLRMLPVRESGFPSADRSDAELTFETEPNSTTDTATKVHVPAVIRGSFAKEKDRDYYEFEVAKGQRLIVAGKTRSLGSPCDLFMVLSKPDGTVLAEANIAGANEGTITNTFGEAGKYHLLVEELNRFGGPGLEYRVDIKPFQPGFALSVETDKVEGPAEGSFELKVSCLRQQYDGPITLAVVCPSQQFVPSNAVIPAKTNEVQLKVLLPKELKPGQFLHFAILGYARIGEVYFETRASTLPAVRKLFPQMLFPPEELDGLIGLGVKPAEKKPPDTPAPKTTLNLQPPTRVQTPHA